MSIAARRRTISAMRLALWAVLGTSAPALAADPAATIILFDGSGSMWGKIPGSNSSKFVIGRDAVRQGLEKLARSAPDLRVGLASFGHRRQGDCNDVEIMMKPESLDAERIGGVLEKLNPKGRGPLVQALREAAKALPPDVEASLVLIHDDLDNCQQDACAAATELKKSHPGLAIHVVGLGLKKEDATRMECVARTMGGRHFDAQDAPQAAAAISEALRLAGAAPAVVAPAPAPAVRPSVAPASASAPAPAPRRATLPGDARPGLYLTAVLAPDGEPLSAPVRWRVYRDPNAAPIGEPVGAAPVLDVAPGSYVVEARTGLVTARRTFDVKANAATLAAVTLDAGALLLQAPLAAGGEPLSSATFTVRAAPPGTPPGTGKVVWVGPATDAPLVLPAGTYTVKAEYGRARQERTATAAVGTLAALEIPLDAGRLKLRTIDREGGGEVDRVAYVVSEDDPDSKQGRRVVARSAAVMPDLTLPAGTYYVSARRGAAEARDRVLLGAGEAVTRTLVLGLATLSVSARLQGSGAPIPEPGSFRVSALDGPPREVARAMGPSARIELAAGRYRIESQIGRQNATVVREFEIKAGGEQRLMLEHPASAVRLRLGGGVAGGSLADVYWEIFDAQGRPIWRTVQPEPQALLAAGRYKARVHTRERLLERMFEIRAGDGRPLEVTLE